MGHPVGHLCYGKMAIFAAISALNCFRSSALQTPLGR